MASGSRGSDEKSMVLSDAQEHVPSVDGTHTLKTRNGITLVPQPSDDPRDPLNWSQRKKYTILVIYCLAGFAGTASSLANQLGFEAQAKLYGKTLVQMSYTVSKHRFFWKLPLMIVLLDLIRCRGHCLWAAILRPACPEIWSKFRCILEFACCNGMWHLGGLPDRRR